MKVQFVIRINFRRNITDENEKEKNVLEYAKGIKCEEKFTITIDEEGYEKKIEINLGMGKKIKVGGIN